MSPQKRALPDTLGRSVRQRTSTLSARMRRVAGGLRRLRHSPGRAASMHQPPVTEARSDVAECPICGTVAERFLPFGARRALPDRQCPRCGSLERHRSVWMYFQTRTNLFTDRLGMLHIAPEPCLATLLQAHQNLDYLSADIANTKAMVQMDITNIRYPSEYFDVIYASHVLGSTPG
jgi:hypothetical protein